MKANTTEEYHALSSDRSFSEQPSIRWHRSINPHVKVEVVRALLKACPSAQDIKVELVSTIPGVDATSERAIYDHYGFIQIQATAKTCAGNLVWVNGEYNVHSGKLMALDIQR